MAIWSHVDGAESDPPFGWMRHLIFKIQRENEPSPRGRWRWKPKRTRLLGGRRRRAAHPSRLPEGTLRRGTAERPSGSAGS